MDFFKMNRQWSEFLDEARAEEHDEKEQVIFEVSEENVETTMGWMLNRGPEDLAFPHIFGNKMRILEFLASPAKGMIGEIIKFFQDSGWEIDFHTGLVTKTVPHEKAPSGFKTITTKIGKALQGLQRMGLKWKKLETASHASAAVEDFAAVDDAYKRLEKSYPAVRRSHLVGSENEGEKVDARVDTWIDFWNKKSQFYREHPDEAFGDQYPVIISRHPVDVMRMADWEQVSSCHSPPESEFVQYEGSEFKCAMKEAQGLGLVVYTLNSSQAKEFFDDEVVQEKLDQLDDEEIFSDEYRGVDGLDPINRGRIRKFVYESGDGPKLLAVPETRVYGKRVPGFYELMKKWALTVQTKEIKELESMGALEPGAMGYGGDSKWDRLGGSYKDSSSDTLFNQLFDTEEWSGNARHKSTGTHEDELVDTSDSQYQEYEDAVENLEYEAQSNLEHCGFNIEVEMDEHPYIYFSAGMSVNFNEEEREKDAEGDVVDMPQQDWDRDSDYMTLMRGLDEALTDLNLYTEEVEMSEMNGNFTVNISITDQDGHHAPDPDGAHDFLQWVKEWDEKYDEIRAAFQDVLLDAGLLKAAPADVLRADDLEFEHFEVEYEHDDDGGMYEVTSISAPIGTGLNPPNVLAGAVDGKPGSGWNVLTDYAQYGSKISWKSFAEKLFKLLDSDLKRVAAQYVQQELPLSESKEEITNSAVEAYKAIYDGFNVTMAARPRAQYDAYSKRIQRGELDPFTPEQMPIVMSMRFQVPRTLDDTAVKFAMEMIRHIDENFDDVLESADAVLQQYNIAYKKYLVQRTQSDELMRDEVEMEIEQLGSLLRRYKGYVNWDYFDSKEDSLKGYKMLNDKWEEGRPMHNLMKIRREETIQPMIQNAENAEPMMQELMELIDFWAEREKLLDTWQSDAKAKIDQWIKYIKLGMEMGFNFGHSVREVGLLPPHPREWVYQAIMMKTDKAFMAHFDPDPNLRPDESHVRENLQEEKKIEEAIRLAIRKVLR